MVSIFLFIVCTLLNGFNISIYCLHTVKWFQVFLSIINSFILVLVNGFQLFLSNSNSLICIELDGMKHGSQIPISIICLHSNKYF